MFAYAGNNPIKYTDPDGNFTFDPHNPSRIIANLDDPNDLRAAAALLYDANLGYTLTAYGETSGIVKNFKNYAEINNYLNPNGLKIDLKISKALDEGSGARAFFFDGQLVYDPENLNINVNTNLGIADVTIPIVDRKNVSIDINLQGMSASGLVGLESSRLGFDVDASIVNGSLNLSFKVGGKKYNIVLEGIIGASASCLVGKDGFKFGAALGPGGSVSVTVEDVE